MECQHSEAAWVMPVPLEVYEKLLHALKSREEFRMTGRCVDCGQRVAIPFVLGSPVVIPE
jgi:hypothetical protein